jgi:site-specific DNA recombinase
MPFVRCGKPGAPPGHFVSLPLHTMPKAKNVPSSTPKCIIGYCRKSTDTEDKQIRSLEDQEKFIRDFYASYEKNEGRSVIIFQESKSAYHPGRPVFNRMIDMIDAGEVSAIIVLDPTRLSRNPEDAGRLIQRLAEGKLEKVMTVSGTKEYSRADTSQLFMLTLENAMSWKDSADKSVRVSITMCKIAQGGGTTGPAPIGYINLGQHGKRKMEIDPIKAPMVVRLFQLAATGAYSLDALVGEAASMGLRSRPTQKYPEGLPLYETMIHQVLHNPTYKGMKKYMNQIHKGQHVPLVDSETWEKVQLELMTRSTNAARPKDLSIRELFVMAGCVRCGKCKQRSLSPYKVKKGSYIMYECKNPKAKCRNCINQDKLVEQLYADIALLKCDEGDHELMRKTLKAIHEKETQSQTDQRAALEKEYATVDRQIMDVFMNIEEAKRQGIFDTVSMKLAQLRMRKEELQGAINKLHDSSQAWIDHVLRSFELAKLVQRAIQIGTPDQRLAVLKALSSSYIVCDGKLVCDWLSPFKEKIEGDHTNWLLGLDSNQGPWR